MITRPTTHHVPADCAECVQGLVNPAYAPQCGHPEAILMAAFGLTADQAAAWATTMSMTQILGAQW